MNNSTEVNMFYHFDFNYEKHMDLFNLSATTHRMPQIPINVQQLLEYKLMTFSEYRLSKSINYYGYIVEVVVGSVANLLVLTIMLGLKHLPICNYMAALALADLSVLASCFIRWLVYEDYDLSTVNTAICRIVQFHSYCSFSLSAWLLVAMTVDRYVAITYPLKAIRFSTPKRARFVIILLIIAMIAINFHFLFTIYVQKQSTQVWVCMAYDQFRYFYGIIWPWIDATVYSFLPFTFLIIFNCLIIRSHIKSTIVHAALKGCGEQSTAASHVSRRITITLLVVTFTFIVLTAPKVILMIIRPTVYGFTSQAGKLNFKMLAQYTLTSSLVNILMYGNHCVNLFLYVLTGHRFRQELADKFKCRCKSVLHCRQLAQAENTSTETIVSNTRTKDVSTEGDVDLNEVKLHFDRNIHPIKCNSTTLNDDQLNNAHTQKIQHQHLSTAKECNVWSVKEHTFSS